MSAPFHPSPEPEAAAAARAIHARRALERAIDHGTALLAALDLPPLALDALDAAIGTLDALDAYGMDREESGDTEPSLGRPERVMQSPTCLCGAPDAELDTSDYEEDDPGEAEPDDEDGGDGELSLGWNETVSQRALGMPSDDGDLTAPERAGRGFVRCASDDAEEDDPAEDSDPAGGEPGSEEDHPWRFERPDAMWRAAELAEVARHGC